MMPIRTRLAFAAAWLLASVSCGAEADETVRLENPRTQRWQIGLSVEAPGACSGIVATLPVPMNWPEQQVEILSQDLSGQVRSVKFRTLEPGGVQQMEVVIPQLAAGDTATALVTFEVIKSDIVAPGETDGWKRPARKTPELTPYLGVSPSIETTHVEIKRLAGEIGLQAPTDWAKVKAIYDWVRANVRYEFDEELQGALTALRAGHGDCEELTSLFIALCRANGIPARSVWIPGHCYPEFYLQTTASQGRWFPCQAAGAEAFGEMREARPILQKGDSFRVPGQAGSKRYVAEVFRAQNAAASPRVQWIRKPLDD